MATNTHPASETRTSPFAQSKRAFIDTTIHVKDFGNGFSHCDYTHEWLGDRSWHASLDAGRPTATGNIGRDYVPGDVITSMPWPLRVLDFDYGYGGYVVTRLDTNPLIRWWSPKRYAIRKQLALFEVRTVRTAAIWNLATIPLGVIPSWQHLNGFQSFNVTRRIPFLSHILPRRGR